MATVITAGSTVLCDKAAGGQHGGTVAVAGSAKLTVKQQGVLLESGVKGKSVGSCATPATSSTKKCTQVSAVTAGLATKLTVGSKAVLTTDLAGTTDGAPPGTVPATAEHTKLTTA